MVHPRVSSLPVTLRVNTEQLNISCEHISTFLRLNEALSSHRLRWKVSWSQDGDSGGELVKRLMKKEKRLCEFGEHQFDFETYLMTSHQIALRMRDFFAPIEDALRPRIRITIYNEVNAQKIFPPNHDFPAAVNEMTAWIDSTIRIRQSDTEVPCRPLSLHPLTPLPHAWSFRPPHWCAMAERNLLQGDRIKVRSSRRTIIQPVLKHLFTLSIMWTSLNDILMVKLPASIP